MKFKNETDESKIVGDISKQLISIFEKHTNDNNWNADLLLKKMKLFATGLRTGKIGIDDILDLAN